MRIVKNLIIGLILLIGGVMLLMLIPSPQAPADKPWEVTVMPDGNSKVLGIHLGHTDYKTAQTQLGVFGETGLFVDPDGSRSVEAYFDSVNLAGLSAKLVLNLALSEAELDAMLSRASSGELQPSGAHQHELAETDREALLAKVVTGLTYIPSVRLKPEMLHSRFGEPATIVETEADANGLTSKTWLYPDLGLSVVFLPEQKPILVYRAKP
jgi:hypothetical protein